MGRNPKQDQNTASQRTMIKLTPTTPHRAELHGVSGQHQEPVRLRESNSAKRFKQGTLDARKVEQCV